GGRDRTAGHRGFAPVRGSGARASPWADRARGRPCPCRRPASPHRRQRALAGSIGSYSEHPVHIASTSRQVWNDLGLAASRKRDALPAHKETIMTSIWDPVRIGNMALEHRFAMAPMTRSRAGADGTPSPLAAEYYAQRASLGLLITGGAQPSDDGQ